MVNKSSSFNKKDKWKKKKNYRFSLQKTIIIYFIVTIIAVITFVLLFPEILGWLPVNQFTLVLNKVSLAFSNCFLNIKSFVVNQWFIGFSLLILLILLAVKKLPYYNITGKKYYTLKKLFLPYYRKISIIIVNSSLTSNNRTTINNSYMNRTNITFVNHLLLQSKQIQMGIFSQRRSVNVFFAVVEHGWNEKKVSKKIEKHIAYLTHSIEMYYNCNIGILSEIQTSKFVKITGDTKTRTKIKISNASTRDLNITDHLYNLLLKFETNNTCIIIQAQKDRKNESKILTSISIFSDKKEITSIICNTSDFSIKQPNLLFRKPNFIKTLTKSPKNNKKLKIENVANLIHIPINYQGSVDSMNLIDFNVSNTNLKTVPSSIVIGKTINGKYSGRDINIDVKDLLLNVEMFGMIGKGKSRLVSSVFRQLVDKKISTVVFDIKGEHARTFTENPNVDILTIGQPRPLCINIFETTDEDDVRDTLLIIEEMLKSSNQEFTAAMKNLFETALFLTHKSPRRNLKTFVKNLCNITTQFQMSKNTTYFQQTLDAVLNRLNFIFNPINFEIIGVSKTTLDFSVLDEGKSIILDLSQFQRRAARPSDIFLICNLILKMLYKHASSKGMTDSLRYMVIMEEAINIIPNFYHTESSASLITAENNFLLGRSLGIGHITISQMWDSVSNVVHANSSTKIVFRSNEKTERIGRALNLSEEEIALVQRLLTQQCFVLSDQHEQAVLTHTYDHSVKPSSYSEYISTILRKYGKSEFPTLYKNFIEMRTELYKQNERTDNRSIKIKESTKKTLNGQKTLENYYLGKSPQQAEQSQDFATFNLLAPNQICERMCSKKHNEKECLEIKLRAKLIKNILKKNFPRSEIAALLKNEKNLGKQIQVTAENKNIKQDDITIFCVVKEIITEFIASGKISDLEAINILVKFIPKQHTFI